MNLKKILESVETLTVHGPDDLEVSSIVYDSRKARPDSLFVVVMGHQLDGADYITEAVAKGTTVVVSETDLDLGRSITHVQVPDARRALAEIASAYYGDLSRKLKVVGVTGTNGKTTTTYMIRNLLRDGGFLPGLLGTVAYEMGGRSIPAARTTPEAPDIHSMFQQMMEVSCDSVVMEISSHAMALSRVHGIDFDICVFTNLTQDHLDYHHDMESYFSAKSELFHQMERRDGTAAVVNIDDPWGQKLAADESVAVEVVSYGFSPAAMVHASKEKISAKGTRFKVFSPWGDAEINLHLLGRFNVHNALAAIAVGGLCGIDLKLIAQSLANIESVPGRLELVPNRKHRKVFVDYAHTDDALKNVLTTLREICKGKLIVVFGCGGNRDRGKRRLMGDVAAKLADYSVVTSDNPRNEEPSVIADDIIQGFKDQKQFRVVLDRRTAIEQAVGMTGRKDILLIAGKGHETYQEFQGTVVPFDDRETVREIFK